MLQQETIEKIKSYLQSPDDEIRELGKSLIVQNFTEEEFSRVSFNLYGNHWLEILFKIKEKEENEK